VKKVKHTDIADCARRERPFAGGGDRTHEVSPTSVTRASIERAASHAACASRSAVVLPNIDQRVAPVSSRLKSGTYDGAEIVPRLVGNDLPLCPAGGRHGST
jgi:hypothetical protein